MNKILKHNILPSVISGTILKHVIVSQVAPTLHILKHSIKAQVPLIIHILKHNIAGSFLLNVNKVLHLRDSTKTVNLKSDQGNITSEGT